MRGQTRRASPARSSQGGGVSPRDRGLSPGRPPLLLWQEGIPERGKISRGLEKGNVSPGRPSGRKNQPWLQAEKKHLWELGSSCRGAESKESGLSLLGPFVVGHDDASLRVPPWRWGGVSGEVCKASSLPGSIPPLFSVRGCHSSPMLAVRPVGFFGV